MTDKSTEWRNVGTLWRLSFIAQIAVLLVALYMAISHFTSQKIFMHVENKLIDGRYPIAQVPDYEFKELAHDLSSALGNYQPYSAQDHFEEVKKYLVEPALTKFRTDILGRDLRAIRDNERHQTFEIDPRRTVIKRDQPNKVVVETGGIRTQIVGLSVLRPVIVTYRFTVEVAPGEARHRLGLVVSDYTVEVIDPERKK